MALSFSVESVCLCAWFVVCGYDGKVCKCMHILACVLRVELTSIIVN